MADLQAIAVVLVPASVTLVGYWIKRQSQKQIDQNHKDQTARLRLDAAMRAATLFGDGGETKTSSASSASGLLALTELGHADLAVALLVDLWSTGSATALDDDAPTGNGRTGDDPDEGEVSTETAILVINAALKAQGSPAQLVAAELLCRNSPRLNPCQSLHWPAAVDGRWLPGMVPRAKLLVMEALILMTTSSPPNENALRSLVVRLYGVWKGEAGNDRVRGCVGTLINAVMPAVERLLYTEFVQASEPVQLEELRLAARSVSQHKDGFLERLLEKRVQQLVVWSEACNTCDFSPGQLAAAAVH
jgi:hypothetical protein